MRYIPNTNEDRTQMLRASGINSINDLFKDIPEKARISDVEKIPQNGLSELELKREMDALAGLNNNSSEYVSFLGGGSYNHFIPSTVKHMIGRAEFYTAYTPYQPEISQGMLTSIFEFQSMICDLMGMDVSNASMYDGATALAEAASLAVHYTGRKTILISKAVHPNYRSVVSTYANGADCKVVEFEYIIKEGCSDINDLTKKITDDTACVITAQPNFFGVLEDLPKISRIAKEKGALSILSTDPVSLGILKRPGDLGIDIVACEGQPFGIPQSFGGPYLGIFAAKKDFIRMMPGRIVGETTDMKGRTGYVLTLQAREQHIRREKAFSNICSNEALCALASLVYLSTMGKSGLKEVADQCLQKSNYTKKKLSKLVAMRSSTFKEFVIKLPRSYSEINKRLHENKIIGGLDLGRFYPELKDHMLVAVTEMNKKEDIDKFVSLIS